MYMMEFEYKIITRSSVGVLTDEQFYAFCQENSHLNFERTSSGDIIIMSPTGGKTSNRNSKILALLHIWNEHSDLGIVFDSSGGFSLPNGAMRSPNAAWVASERWNKLTEEEKEGFPPLCPDFVIELKSKTDSLKTLKLKMQEWLENGCCLAWLIDIEEKQVYIYRSQQEAEVYSFSKGILSGEEVLPGFSLNLQVLL
jgi:Uma2 family endonuclease